MSIYYKKYFVNIAQVWGGGLKKLKDIHRQHKIFSQETWMVAHTRSDNLVVQSYLVALPLQEGGMSYENAA